MTKFYRCARCEKDVNGIDLENGNCPHCGSEEMWEVDFCEYCGRCFDNEGDDDTPVYDGICEDCLHDIIRCDADVALEYIDHNIRLQIDFYVERYFHVSADLDEDNTSIELVELCRDAFLEVYNSSWEFAAKDAGDILFDFIDDELSDFAEWYIRRKQCSRKTE